MHRHLPLAPATTVITLCHLCPCAVPGRACWEVWCVDNCLAQATLREGWSHRMQSAPKIVQKCREDHRKMRRGEKLWQVLAKRGTRGNWRREGGSQLAKCYEGTQEILQRVKKCTKKCKHKDNSRMWSDTHLQAQGNGKSALGNGKCWEVLCSQLPQSSLGTQVTTVMKTQ